MSLIAYNLSETPLALWGTDPVVYLPASGEAVNVTAEFRTMDEAAFDLAAEQQQQIPTPVRYTWTGAPEYSTYGLPVGTAGGVGSTEVAYIPGWAEYCALHPELLSLGEDAVVGNIYPTFAQAYAAAKATGMPCTLYIEDVYETPIIEPGYYDLNNITLSARGIHQANGNVWVYASDGVFFRHMRQVRFLTLHSDSNFPIWNIGTYSQGASVVAYDADTKLQTWSLTSDYAPFWPDQVGSTVLISDADTGGNNGEYDIVSVPDPYTIVIYNEGGTATDVNNGSIAIFAEESDYCALIGAVLISQHAEWLRCVQSELNLWMENGAALIEDGGYVLVSDDGGTINLVGQGAFTEIGNDSISSYGCFNLWVDSSFQFHPESNNMVGGTTGLLADQATWLGYEFSDAANWFGSNPSTVLGALDNLSARRTIVTMFEGRNGTGVCTMQVGASGDFVQSLVATATGGGLTLGESKTASFEATLTVNGQIQQTSASDYSGIVFLVSLLRVNS